MSELLFLFLQHHTRTDIDQLPFPVIPVGVVLSHPLPLKFVLLLPLANLLHFVLKLFNCLPVLALVFVVSIPHLCLVAGDCLNVFAYPG